MGEGYGNGAVAAESGAGETERKKKNALGT